MKIIGNPVTTFDQNLNGARMKYNDYNITDKINQARTDKSPVPVTNIDSATWSILPIIFVFALAICISINKSKNIHSLKKIKLIFLTWFISIVLPPTVIHFLVSFSNSFSLSSQSASILSALSKIFIVILAMWAGNRFKFKIIWQIGLGLLVLLPFGPWITLVIVWSRRDKNGR